MQIQETHSMYVHSIATMPLCIATMLLVIDKNWPMQVQFPVTMTRSQPIKKVGLLRSFLGSALRNLSCMSILHVFSSLRAHSEKSYLSFNGPALMYTTVGFSPCCYGMIPLTSPRSSLTPQGGQCWFLLSFFFVEVGWSEL